MIRHVASIAEIVDDVPAAVRFYREALGLTVEHEEGTDYALVKVSGILHYGIWGRRAAAESTLGDAGKANQVALGFTVGFEVDEIESDSQSVAEKAGPLTQKPKTEPWGQKTSRLPSVSGALCELAETPWARRVVQDVTAEGDA